MRRTAWLQETRLMSFEEAYGGWTESRLSQEKAALLRVSVSAHFVATLDRYEEDGLEGLIDKCLSQISQISHRRAAASGVMGRVDRYRNRHRGWNVKHDYAWYKSERAARGRSERVFSTHQDAWSKHWLWPVSRSWKRPIGI